MNTFWSDLGVVSGNTSATNQYDLFNGLTFNDGFVCSSQYDFFTHLGTNRYEFFKSYNSVDSNIIDEYTFFQNTSDPNIYNFNTFFEYAGSFINSVPVTPTPTPTQTITPTPTITPTITPTSTLTPTPTPSAVVLPSVDYITYRTSTTDSNSYSFSSTSIVGPGLIIVGCSYSSSSSNPSITSLTMNGVSATKVVQALGSSFTLPSTALFALRITGGTTADISMTLSDGKQARCMGISVWRVQNNNSDTITISGANMQGYGSSVSTTLTSILSNSVIVAVNSTYDQLGSPSPVTWTNATERFDINTEGNDYMSGGDSTSSGGGSLTITSATSGGEQSIAICALAIR
jgi:hypothetical protein